jgi:lipoprotein-anchoring transpeptidase ErfK/SrfK
MPRSRRLRTALIVVALSAAAGRATAATPTTTPRVTARATASTRVVAPTTTVLKPISAGNPLVGWDRIGADEWPMPGDAVVAHANHRYLEVLRAPSDRKGALRLDPNKSVYGPLNLLALGAKDGWVRVAIPVRPNGSVGWVWHEDVSLARTTARLVVELSTNTLWVVQGADTLATVKVATGTGGTPTPTGLFFVKELVPQSNPGGPLGPYALGLSGFSNVLTKFNGGEGVIGIHGTNAPNTIGTDASHGCVRVDNATMLKLARLLELGTPVEIVQRVDQLPPKEFRRSSDWLTTAGFAAPEPTTAPDHTLSAAGIAEPTSTAPLAAEPGT